MVPSVLCSFSLEGEPTVCGAWSGRTKGETGTYKAWGTDKTTAGNTGSKTLAFADVGGDKQWAQAGREAGREAGRQGGREGWISQEQRPEGADTGTWYGRHVLAPRLANAVLLMK